MDYEEISNLNNTITTPIPPSMPSDVIIHDVLFSIFSIVAILSNTLIIYTVLRFKRLRTAPYMFLASWTIADLCSLLFLPSSLRLAATVEYVSLPYEVFCIFIQMGAALHCATVVFVTLVAIDWAIAAYHPRASQKFRNRYKILLGVLWTIVFIFGIVSVYYCWIEWLHFVMPLMVLAVTLATTYLVVIVIQIKRLVLKLRKKSSDYPGLAINLATAFLCCWSLNIVNLFFVFSIYLHELLIIFSFCLIYSSSIINFSLLYRYDNDFCACVKQVLSCKRIKYEEDLNERISMENSVNSNSVQISFDSSG